MIATSTGSHCLLQLEGETRTIRRLAADQSHVQADGGRPLCRYGEAIPLLGFVDPPIQVDMPAYLIVGGLSDKGDYISTRRQTSIMVEIYRAS